MVEQGELEVGGSTTQMISLTAVTYHNLAILHLTLRDLGEAFMCSQNARRLARLSLNYTNRWTDQMEHTHKVVMCEIAAKLKYIDKTFQNYDQEFLFSTMLTSMG